MAPTPEPATRQTPARSKSTDSASSASKQQQQQRECRRVVSAFSSDVLPTSVYGDNYFLPAAVIMESSKGACDYKTKVPPRGGAPPPAPSSKP